jgi:voltage-gated potassium channel Kch
LIKTKVKGKFLFLLVSLLLISFFFPFVQRGPAGIFILDIVFLFILLSSIFAITEKKRVFVISLLLALAAFASTVLNYFLVTISLRLITVSVYGLFFTLMAVTILSSIMKSKKVTTETIYASICVYLLIGVIWTMLFSAIEIIEPGSFLSGGSAIVDLHGDPLQRNVFAKFIYYSFVTLTTLGYGDIIPISPHARALSSLEAVVGQLFIAILIARLVGMHIVHETEKKQSDEY